MCIVNKTGKYNIYISIFISIAGIIVSYILAQEYYFGQLFQKTGEELSIFSNFSNQVCGGESSFFDCSKVGASEFSTFLNIPLASWGILYFLLIAIISFFCLLIKNKIRSLIYIILFVIITFGSLFDLIMLCISIFYINAICILCTITYFCNWIIFCIFFIYLRKKGECSIKQIAIIKELFITEETVILFKYILLFIIALMISMSAFFYVNQSLISAKKNYIDQIKDKRMNEIANEILNERSVDINPSTLSIIGNPEAPVTIVEFSDFLCPACSRVSLAIEGIIHENSKKAKLVFMNYPLDKCCNNNLRRQFHPGACELAKGAICASRQNKFEQYHNTAFRMSRPDFGNKEITKIASISGLDISKFEECMSSPETEKELQNQINKARELGVKGTPTIFINGKKCDYKPIKALFERLIDYEYKKAGY